MSGSNPSGHGVHWKCVYESLDWFAQEHLPVVYRRLVDEGDMVGDIWEASGGEGAGEPLAGYFDRRGDIRHLIIHIVDHKERTLRFVSAYPYAVTGVTHPIRISEIVEWDNKAEGQIKGITEGGAFIAFFDPLFFINKPAYRVGEKYLFSLSALAYQAGPAADGTVEIPITDEILELLPEEEHPEEATVHVSTRGLAAILPLDFGDIDDFSFQAPVRSLQRILFEDRTVFRMRATVMRPGDEDFAIMLYASRHVLEHGFEPRDGDDLAGTLWMQGYLATPHPH